MNENQPSRFMLMFTIGPVQSFIEAARKTEDLWMGSYILSYLVATAMEKIQGYGVEIIYPAIGNKSPFKFWEKNFDTPSFPNLFLAIGDEISQSDLVKRAKKAEKNVTSEFESMAKRVLDEAFDTRRGTYVKEWRETYVKELYNRQIPDFFDIYWVITEEKTEEEYGKWYARTASSLAAIKNCRTFKQTEEFGRKCSLDGIREILHKKEGKDEREHIENAMQWWKDFAKRTPRHCRQKEALCAVSLTKRMGRHYLRTQSVFKDEFDDRFSSGALSFPSTSEVATASFKKRIVCKPDALEIYRQFCKAVLELRKSEDEEANIPKIKPLPKIKCPLPNNVDGEWLYEETYSDSYLERYYNIDAKKEETQIERCKNLRKKLVQELGEPGKYYAAIALDGDDMGEKIRDAGSREKHKELSNELIEYTETARQIVEKEHLGKLTYAGGDDLLALANLNDLLPILRKLRKRFPKFTGASAGVCIAHHKMPLTNVIAHARRMEKKAKEVDKKDALGIVLYKHSGNVSEMVTKWKCGKDKDLNVLAIGMKLSKLLDNDEISKRFLYTFRDAFKKLIDDDGKLAKRVLPLVKTEFNRLIERAYKKKGQDFDAHKEAISKTIDLLPKIRPFTDYLSFLEIINFITRESK